MSLCASFSPREPVFPIPNPVPHLNHILLKSLPKILLCPSQGHTPNYILIIVVPFLKTNKAKPSVPIISDSTPRNVEFCSKLCLLQMYAFDYHYEWQKVIVGNDGNCSQQYHDGVIFVLHW